MDKVKHTDWKLDKETSIQVPFEGEYAQIACISRTTWSSPEQSKNIRFREITKNYPALIVTAVNAHDKLVNAVEAVLDQLEKSTADSIAIQAARAELAKLKGGNQ